MPLFRISRVGTGELLEVECDVGAAGSVRDLKAAIALQTGADAALQRVVVSGKVLKDEVPLSSLDPAGARIFLALLPASSADSAGARARTSRNCSAQDESSSFEVLIRGWRTLWTRFGFWRVLGNWLLNSSWRPCDVCCIRRL
eukprot:TRINITY_DN9475_c0_g1_i1.p1 TRINITY_DN9475_c0_g1~~TRINITY_DN9475_c0_g1_i1.p1  ORF type:complete len:143 (-),score=17.53 TRINITY_DN9475_c0_g1_i1:161-589(-)